MGQVHKFVTIVLLVAFMLRGIYGQLGQKVEFCNNQPTIANEFEMEARIIGYHDTSSNCVCDIQLYNGDSTEIRFYSHIYGCNYRAKFLFNGRITNLDCDEYEHILEYSISKDEVFEITFEPYNSTTDERSYFLLYTSIISLKSENNLTVTCSIVQTTLVTTQPTTTRVFTTTTSNTTQSTTTTVPSQTTTTLLPSLCDYHLVQKTSSSVTGIAIGCFLGGTVFGIILLLGIFMLRKKQREKSTIYDSTIRDTRPEEQHTYDTVNLGTTNPNVEYVNTVHP